MSGTEEGFTKREQAMIKEYGSLEAYKEKLREWGRKGGHLSTGGFRGMTPEQRSEAGKKGHRALVEKIRKGEL